MFSFSMLKFSDHKYIMKYILNIVHRHANIGM